MKIVVTPARAAVFMDPGLRRDDVEPDQPKTITLYATAASPSAAWGADWPSSQDWNINIAQS